MKLFALLLSASVASVVNAATTDIYLVAGQSNAVGALGSLGVPADVNAPVPFYYHVTPGATHLDSHGTLGSVWSTGGPELAFADSLYERGDNIAIVKTAINGSSLFTEWDHNRPESYSHTLIAKTLEALDAIPDSRIAGMLWIQGESDATSWGRANAYCDNMITFSGVLFEEFGEFPIYYNQLHSGAVAPWRWLVRQEQEELDGLPNFTMLNMDDLTLRDDLHYTGPSIVEMGRRFATAIPSHTVSGLEQFGVSYGVDAGFDLDGDGMTDGNDFLLWQRGPAAPAAQLSAVPEPVLWWWLPGVALLSRFRRS